MGKSLLGLRNIRIGSNRGRDVPSPLGTEKKHFDFYGTTWGFSDKKASRELNIGSIKPYERILPGMIWGCAREPEHRADVQLHKDESNEDALFLNFQAPHSRFLTLEFDLDHTALANGGVVSLMLEASAVPTTSCRAAVRFSTPDVERGFHDAPLRKFVFTSNAAPITISGFVDPVLDNKRLPVTRAKLILFMSKRELTLAIRRISISPAPIAAR
ncbi:MAG: hypothetical protein C0606_13805 [Hyphomicrobiales bacterium]|nr:MAG: hypothetical protein C0606_13805 [Hyphomicrobiales bacterium]